MESEIRKHSFMEHEHSPSMFPSNVIKWDIIYLGGFCQLSIDYRCGCNTRSRVAQHIVFSHDGTIRYLDYVSGVL